MKPPIFLDAADILRLRTALAYDKAFEVKGAIKGPVPNPPPVPPPSIFGFQFLFAVCSPDNGQQYLWTPRTGDTGTITGHWVLVEAILQAVILHAQLNPDDGLLYSWIPRVSDTLTLSGQWVLSSGCCLQFGVLNPDDGVLYTWIPRTGDTGTITGQWLPVCAI